MTSANLILYFVIFFSAVFDYSDFCHIWQFKDYRLDRMRDFMSTKHGHDFLKKYNVLWRPATALILFFLPINNITNILWAVLMIDLIRNIYNVYRHKVIRPAITKKAILLIALALLLETIIIITLKNISFILLILAARFFIMSIIAIALILPSSLVKKYFIHRAAQKIASYQNLKVIGITGSYGKTSVKTFLSHVLSGKFRVIHAPKNTNTEIGIALFILKTDFSQKDIFVVEMGAYKIGEIDLICRMVKPQIGVLTAIAYQHLALFGNIKNTQQAKYELLRSLPKEGLAITNIDNEYCREFLPELKTQVKTFGTTAELVPTCLVQGVESINNGISCSFKFENRDWKLFAPIISEHNALNLAPCLIIARHLGMTEAEIEKQFGTLQAPDKTMRLYSYGTSTIIDDSYNANYQGFCAALDTFSTFPQKLKIVITNGIPELGEKSIELHEQIGKEISYTADVLAVVNSDFYEPLKRGVGEKSKTKTFLIEDAGELQKFIENYKNQDAVILIESRIPEKVYKQIIIKK